MSEPHTFPEVLHYPYNKKKPEPALRVMSYVKWLEIAGHESSVTFSDAKAFMHGMIEAAHVNDWNEGAGYIHRGLETFEFPQSAVDYLVGCGFLKYDESGNLLQQYVDPMHDLASAASLSDPGAADEAVDVEAFVAEEDDHEQQGS